MAARWRSLDVLRGATVALMILVNNPGSWQHLYPPLAHAPWHGCSATDLVFPFFLFVVGHALALVQPGLLQDKPGAFATKLLRRTLWIFALGLLLNAAPFVRWDMRWDASGQLLPRDWAALRTMGVLQRIALAWCGAALVVWWLRGRPRPVLAVVATLLLGYWGLCVTFGTPGDPYSLEGFFGTRLDRALLGPAHLYQGEGVPFDPEGLASTLPALAQVLIGWWVGDRLRRTGSAAPQLLQLFITATLLLALAHAWQWVMPLNKKLWTSAYVLHTSALAIMALGLLLHAIEGAPGGASTARPAWAEAAIHAAEAFGRNALFIFVLSGLVPRLLGLLRWADGVDAGGQPRFITPLPWLYRTLFADLAPDPRFGSLAFALANLALYWALARWLDRRGLYFRV